MKVKITWATGKVEFLERSDCDTVEQVTNSVFGSQWELAAENGVKVEAVTDEEHAAGLEQEGQAQADHEIIVSQGLQKSNDEEQVITGSDVGDLQSILGL